MQASMPRFNTAQVLVVGDVMIDRYWYGDTSRISPEAPVPVVKVSKQEDRPGGAANVALNVAALGAAAKLTGIVGRDEAADNLRATLSSANIASDFHVVDGKPTITKLRVISRQQQLIRMDMEEAYGPADSSGCLDKMSQLLAGSGAVILSDYGKGSLHDVQAFIALAKKMAVPVLADPKGTDFSRYRGQHCSPPTCRNSRPWLAPATVNRSWSAAVCSSLRSYPLMLCSSPVVNTA